MTTPFSTRKAAHGLIFTTMLAAASLLAGCGAGSGTTTPSDNTQSPAVQQEKGDVFISLTDAEGDFLNYVVEVTQLTLTHSNGAVLSVLPATTAVDFAQYVDTSELLGISSVPRGRYDSASISLDFSQSQIIVQDEAGNPVVAEPIDSTGVALGEITVDLNFRDGDRFVVTRGLLSHLALDFDLNASNQIEFTDEAALVTVNPVLMADVLHNHTKPTRLRGLVEAVDSEAQKIELSVRPFHQRAVHFGTANVYVDGDTQYEINGLPIENSLGLQTLGELEDSSALVAIGRWETLQRRFLASEIYAGSSVPCDGADFIKGTVVAREGNQISLRGAVLEQYNGQVTLNDTFTLQFGDEVRVSRKQTLVSPDAISVGSRIYASGTAISESQFDAYDGFIRIRPSVVTGDIVGLEPLTLDLQMVNARRLELFDFSGTAASEEQDADPSHYEVDLQTLNPTGLIAGEPVKVIGYVQDFGAAPEDFIAETVADISNIDAFLLIDFGLHGHGEALHLGESGMTMDLGHAGRKHHVFRAANALDLQTLDSDPTIVAAQGGLFTIVENRTVNIYRHYNEFSSNLASRLHNGERVRQVHALGAYSENGNEIHGRHIRIVIAN